MKYNFKQIELFCKYNTILISRKVNIKKGKRVLKYGLISMVWTVQNKIDLDFR